MRHGGRLLAQVVGALFVVSAIFPVGAAFVKNPLGWSRWWGVTDVTIAFTLALLSCLVAAVWDSKVTQRERDLAYGVYRGLPHGILVLVVIFFLAGDRIAWNNCLPGFAWRTWLLLYTLPAWLAALADKPGGHPPLP